MTRLVRWNRKKPIGTRSRNRAKVNGNRQTTTSNHPARARSNLIPRATSAGDESGGGDKGGGQPANQAGRDSPGSNTSSDQGNTGSPEAGQGDTSDRGGQEQKSPDKTGQSGQEAGDGSQSQASSEGSELKPEGAQPQTPQDPVDPNKVASPNDANQQDPNNKTAGGMSSGNPDGGGIASDSMSMPSNSQREIAEADAANLEHARKATDLVLESLKDQQDEPDPELLKSLGWTKEELQAFIARWESMKRNAREQGGDAETELEDALRSLGLRRTGPGRRASNADNDQYRGMQDGGSRRRPPPEILEQFKAYRKGAARGQTQWRLTHPVSDALHRYLVPFSLKQIPHFFTDVLIIGGGLAGMRAACAIDPKLSVLVVTKDQIDESASSYAQGGIAGVLDPDDCFDSHVHDTLIAGGDLCDAEVVSMVVSEAPKRIRELIQWGTHFDENSGVLELGREGGHSRSRVAHALGDATGREIMRAMISWTSRLRNVHVREHTFTLDLLTYDGVCRGAIVADKQHGLTLVWAQQTILCTGGAGQIYRESTNPPVATGDGHAIAYRAGVELRDMEFIQFHPTVLYIAGSSRSLITEAVRGEGACLVDHNGCRFMADYDSRGELAPRDVVSQAIVTQMEKTAHPCVYLDMTHLEPDFVRGRFPGIAAKCQEFGIDITTRPDSRPPGCPLHDRWRDRRPQRPDHAARPLGGRRSDFQRTARRQSLGLQQPAGSLGLRCPCGPRSIGGRRRYGKRLPRISRSKTHPWPNPSKPLDLADIRNSLTSLMWRDVGVRRSADRMHQALEMIDRWRPLRAGTPVLRSPGLGTAEYADRGPADRPSRLGTRRIAGRPLAHRFPGNGQPALAASHPGSAGKTAALVSSFWLRNPPWRSRSRGSRVRPTRLKLGPWEPKLTSLGAPRRTGSGDPP